MTSDEWAAATFEGAADAQRRTAAALSPDERVALLERLIQLARDSGALQRAREEKQRALDALWSGREPV